MSLHPLRVVMLGLSITSSWGNGHASTYRSLVRELSARGHAVLFLERDASWYRENRDMPSPPWGRTRLYGSLEELKDSFEMEVREADFVMVGSYVPEGREVGEWVNAVARGATAFYDIDTPVTLSKLERGDCEYLTPELISRYDIYFSFTGGPILKTIETRYASPMARPLYCSVDPAVYRPLDLAKKWEMGYLGTYSPDRQPVLDRLMLEPARRSAGGFVVAGPMYPEGVMWPENTQRIEHLPPGAHSAFYGSMKFTINITRADMVRAGYSPSVRLFEAAACATPIISDYWEGLGSFFKPVEEILVSRSAEESLRYLQGLTVEDRMAIGEKARKKVLSGHTASHRVDELESYMAVVLKKQEVLK
ncbi:MAG: glycosyltransferase [Deltaproteobacteria bacterium GWA2_54_12]|nr:MAG: glycosyltransferase [Deltaproteobacteria bacterium GWA2_54_12]